MNLSDLRMRVRAILMDTAGLIWADAALDEAVRQALDDYSLVRPQVKSAVLSLPSTSPELDLSSLAGFNGLLQVTLPWDETNPFASNICQGWTLYWDGTVPKVVLRSTTALRAGQPLRLLYEARQVIEGLDGALETSLDPLHFSLLAQGAAGYAARSRSLDRSEGFRSVSGALASLSAWSHDQLQAYAAGLRRLRSHDFAIARWELDE